MHLFWASRSSCSHGANASPGALALCRFLAEPAVVPRTFSKLWLRIPRVVAGMQSWAVCPLGGLWPCLNEHAAYVAMRLCSQSPMCRAKRGRVSSSHCAGRALWCGRSRIAPRGGARLPVELLCGPQTRCQQGGFSRCAFRSAQAIAETGAADAWCLNDMPGEREITPLFDPTPGGCITIKNDFDV